MCPMIREAEEHIILAKIKSSLWPLRWNSKYQLPEKKQKYAVEVFSDVIKSINKKHPVDHIIVNKT